MRESILSCIPIVTDPESTCTDPGTSSSSEDETWSNDPENSTAGAEGPLTRVGDNYVQDNAYSLLQKSVRMTRKGGRWTSSFAVAAATKLPPPGNGKKGRVSFSDVVEVEGQALPDLQGNEFWQSLCSDILADVDRSETSETVSFVEDFVQTAVRRVCLTEESVAAGPSLEERWTERFRNRQHELGIEGVPAFLQAPEGLPLRTQHLRSPSIELPIDDDENGEVTDVIQAHIMTPVGPFWCQDVEGFRRQLSWPFELIPLQLFGLEDGFCVCDVCREVLPIAFVNEQTGLACILYFAYGTTAREIRQVWPSAELFVENDFRVKEWGQVLPFAFQQRSQGAVEVENLKAQYWQFCQKSGCGVQTSKRGFQSPVPEAWFEQIHQLWDRPLAGLPEGIKLHAATVHALQQMTSKRPDQKKASCVIYVDGASNKHGQSWSMVVTTQGTSDQQWVETLEGVCADVVQFDRHDSKWLGATRQDNVDAELVAILVALVYALSLHLDVQVLVRPDLRYSVELVQGMVAPSMQRPLTSLVANVGSLLRAQGLFAVFRVRAHIGHAWNELADTMAVHAGKHGSVGNPNYGWLNQL